MLQISAASFEFPDFWIERFLGLYSMELIWCYTLNYLHCTLGVLQWRVSLLSLDLCFVQDGVPPEPHWDNLLPHSWHVLPRGPTAAWGRGGGCEVGPTWRSPCGIRLILFHSYIGKHFVMFQITHVTQANVFCVLQSSESLLQLLK